MASETQSTGKRISCPSCNLIRINGVICHEQGCPDNHLFTTYECKWCGNEFQPEAQGQDCCDNSCAEAYYG